MTARRSASNAAVIAVAMRWSDRLLGVVSIAILARLLTPADFGIVAMASLAKGLIEVVLSMGVSAALLQNPQATQEHYDTAWTLRLIQAGVTALLLCAAIPLATNYFSEPLLGPVLVVLALSSLIGGLENIGVVTFQRDFRAGLDFRFVLTNRLVTLVGTLVLAYFLRTYWALIWSMVLHAIVGVVLSYRLSPMRPRLSFARLREILSFSSWMLLRNIVVYFNNRLHTLVVGRGGNTATLGSYNLANEIAVMPSTELLAPLSRVLLPAFAQLRDDRDALKQRFLMAQGVQVLVALPMCVGLALTAADLVPVFLGPDWGLVVGFLQVASFIYAATAISTSGGYLLLATGQARLSMISPLLQLGVFCVGAFMFASPSDPQAVLGVRLFAALCGLLVFLFMIRVPLPMIRLTEILSGLWRPMLASLTMTAAVLLLGRVLATGTLATLLSKVAVGGVVYLTVGAALWWLARRPEGAERFLLDWVRQRVSSLRRRTA